MTNVYTTIAILLFFGLILGDLAKRIKLPSITGNILAGLLLGPIFHIVDTTSPTIEAQFEPMVHAALSLIAISIGSHLQFRKLRNAMRRIVVIGLIEMWVTPFIVFVLTFLTLTFSKPFGAYIWESALFMGVLALATAPATVLHVVKEAQARGIFVKTLIAVVVFNNVANIFLFESLHHWIFDPTNILFLIQLPGAILLGVAVAFLLMFAWERTSGRKQTITVSFAALVISYGVALMLGLSPVLANLSLGITIANFSERNKILEIFEDFEGIIMTGFFTLMGSHAHFDHLASVGILAAVYFFGRIGGNIATIAIARRFTSLPKKVKRHLPLALTPHAGLTVGLLVSLRTIDNTGLIPQTIIPVVLLAVTLSEVLGPLALRFSLRRSGEEKQALPRMIDFLQEEYIKVGIKATTRNDALQELVDFLFRSRPLLKKLDKEAFLKGILEREERGNTAVTAGLAIPHFKIEAGPKLFGVMGIIPEGIQWHPEEQDRVHVIILIAIPPNHHKQHLGALSTIAKLFRKRSVADRGLHLARTVSEVYEALFDEEFDSLNQVLEEESIDMTPENPELAERFSVQALSNHKVWNLRKKLLHHD